jgi:hypothetical protein
MVIYQVSYQVHTLYTLWTLLIIITIRYVIEKAIRKDLQ